jgi:hypothetical protein
MKIKKLLRFLDDAKRILRKLGTVALKAYRLAKLLHDIYKIVAH